MASMDSSGSRVRHCLHSKRPQRATWPVCSRMQTYARFMPPEWPSWRRILTLQGGSEEKGWWTSGTSSPRLARRSSTSSPTATRRRAWTSSRRSSLEEPPLTRREPQSQLDWSHTTHTHSLTYEDEVLIKEYTSSALSQTSSTLINVPTYQKRGGSSMRVGFGGWSLSIISLFWLSTSLFKLLITCTT